MVHRLGQAVSSIGNVPGLEDRLQRSLATVKLAESSPRLPFSEVLKTARTNTLSAYGTSSDPTGAPSTPLYFAVSREDWDIVDVFAGWPESGDLKQSREMLADRLTSLDQHQYIRDLQTLVQRYPICSINHVYLNFAFSCSIGPEMTSTQSVFLMSTQGRLSLITFSIGPSRRALAYSIGVED